ncbi:MAG: hypothetical protein ACMXYK_04155 [Candidatus Woesearchaeota archaeon]
METFQKEKEFYRHKSSSIGANWQMINDSDPLRYPAEIDPDIYSFLVLVNAFPFMYSAGMCCSGTYKDHDFRPVSHNERFGIRIKDPQGYCVIRADTNHEYWKTIETILCDVPHATLTPSLKWERKEFMALEEFPIIDGRQLYAYQIFTGNNKIKDTELPYVWGNLSIKLMEIIHRSNIH